MKNILIVTGGNVEYEWAKTWINEMTFDYVIAADSGLIHCDRLGIKVDYLLGDYDSVDKNVFEKYNKSTQTKTYPPEKDYTDTHLALLKAIQKSPDSVYIIGATGSRFDHVLTNIAIMKLALDRGVKCFIYDKCNKIYLEDKTFSIDKDKQYGKFVSFVPLTENVLITLKGMKYPLNEYNLKQGLSICQSNEIVDDSANVIIDSGILIVFETRD